MTVSIDRVIGALLLLVVLLLGLLLVSGPRRGRRKPGQHPEPASAPHPAARDAAPERPPAEASLAVTLEEDVTQVYVRAHPAPGVAPPVSGSEPPAESADCRKSDSRVKLAFEVDAEEEETTSPLARLLISAKGDSDCGRRRQANEDCLLFLPEQSVFGVADGMGGYRGGQVASSLAVETVRQSFERERFVGRLSADKPLPRRGQELASAVLQANWAVFESARRDPHLSQMGTTLVAARFSPNKQRVYIANVGDSRCYRLRGGRLRQLTTDQTMRLVGLQGPGANDLLQAIGVTSDLAIDLLVDRPEPNDVYLLCSDGLPKMVKDEEIERVLNEEPDLEAAVYGLIERANDHGGKDNVTVVLVKVVERPVSALIPSFHGWSKLPDSVRAAGSDEVAAIGVESLDEPTVIGVRPRGEARRGA